jgi:hypothetical protein
VRAFCLTFSVTQHFRLSSSPMRTVDSVRPGWSGGQSRAGCPSMLRTNGPTAAGARFRRPGAPYAADERSMSGSAVGRRDSALMDEQVPSAGCIQRRARMVPGRSGGRHAKAPVTGAGICAQRGRDLRTTERAGAHSPQFGTYAQWTAGLLAALAVRPVPSCTASVPRGVNDKTPSDAYPTGKTFGAPERRRCLV